MITRFFLTLLLLSIRLLVFAQYWQPLDSTCCQFGQIIEAFDKDTVNHRLFVAGNLQYFINTVSHDNIAQYYPQTNTWNYVGQGFEQFGFGCYAVKYYHDTLFLGGDFAFGGPSGSQNTYVAYWDGASWQRPGSLIFGSLTPSSAYSFTEFNSSLYMGGRDMRWLYNATQDTINCLAKYDGTEWRAVGGTGFNAGVFDTLSGGNIDPSTIYAINAYNNNLFIAGYFAYAGGNFANYAPVRWDGTNWYVNDTNNYVGVVCFGKYNGGFYAGGEYGIIKYMGNKWQSFVTIQGNGGQPYIYSMKEYNGKFFVGGTFDTINGVPCKNFAVWDGVQWQQVGGGITNLNPYPTEVKALEELDGCLYVGGWFTHAGTMPVNSIVKWCEPLNTEQIKNEIPTVAISPNPAKDKLTLTLKNKTEKKYQFILYDITGREQKHFLFSKSTTIDISNLAQGVYIYKVITDNGVVIAGKFIKQ
jgi:hypothetical protein